MSTKRVRRNYMRDELLELANKSLTGCVPPSLLGVPENDLDRLGLPDCAEE